VLAGPEAEQAAGSAGPKARKRISELKIGFLNLPRLWKFCRTFRRNFDMRIFPKFF
jgi:hypothetical protein